jgi:peptide/nickel transport system substrate-binding protein
VTSVDVIDSYTVRLNVPKYDVALLTGLCASQGFMVSPTALKTLGDAAMLHPVGTGPFKFASYQTDVSLKFEKWDGYWQKGKPYLDGLEFVFIKDPVTQLSSFQAGEAQVIKTVTAKDVATLQATGKYNLVKYLGKMYGMAGDSAHSDSPFANIKVRQAIAYAIDNAAIAKAVGFGLYEAANQISAASSPYYDPAVVGYPYNPTKAKQLLSDAGYPNGFDTTITFNSTDADQVAMFALIQGYLSAVNIKVKLDAADPARFAQVTVGGWKNQLVWFGSGIAKGLDPSAQLTPYLTKDASRYDPKSILIPDDYQAKFVAACSEPDPVKSTQMFKDLRKIITDDYCIVMPISVGVVLTWRYVRKSPSWERRPRRKKTSC